MAFIEAIRERAQAVRNIYRLDQSPWEERVRQLDSESLLKELNRNKKLLDINGRLGQLEVLGEVMGSVTLFLSGLKPEGAGVAGLSIGSLLIHGRPAVVLDNRIKFINSEVDSRKEKAIFYQDVPTLAALEGAPI